MITNHLIYIIRFSTIRMRLIILLFPTLNLYFNFHSNQLGKFSNGLSWIFCWITIIFCSAYISLWTSGLEGSSESRSITKQSPSTDELDWDQFQNIEHTHYEWKIWRRERKLTEHTHTHLLTHNSTSPFVRIEWVSVKSGRQNRL